MQACLFILSMNHSRAYAMLYDPCRHCTHGVDWSVRITTVALLNDNWVIPRLPLLQITLRTSLSRKYFPKLSIYLLRMSSYKQMTESGRMNIFKVLMPIAKSAFYLTIEPALNTQ